MKKSAQTFIEYTLLFGILISLLIAMTPLMKRGIQGMIKVVADQVGTQQNADQPGGKSGQLDNAYIVTRVDSEKNVRERLGDTTYDFIKEDVATESTISSNVGFTERN